MLGPETGKDQRRENERRRGGGMVGPRLRKSLPFVAAFLAGFLLGRQDGGDPPEEWTDGEGVDVREAVARVRQRMMLTGTGDAGFAEGDDGEVERPQIAGGGTGVADESPEMDAEYETDDEHETDAKSRVEEEFEVDTASGVDDGTAPGEGVEVGEGTGVEKGLEVGDEADEGVGFDEKAETEENDADTGENDTDTDENDADTDAGGATGPDEVTSAEETDEIDTPAADLVAPTVRGMPTLGVGTAEDWDYDECLASIRTALQIGYRHVDATERREAYHNETPVGEAIEQSGLPREDLFVATKVSPADLDYDAVLTSAEESLDRLEMDYVDLLYVHWPTGEYGPEETLDAFAELRREGLIEEIGVSNFTVDLLEEAIEVSEEPVFANQVEMHPLLPQEDLREFCARDDVGVELVAYSPIARGDVEDVTELQEVAAKHEITPEQVSLAWLREKGVTAIPEATTEDHLRENWLSLGVDLDDEDVEKLDSIEERRRIVDPDEAPWNR